MHQHGGRDGAHAGSRRDDGGHRRAGTAEQGEAPALGGDDVLGDVPAVVDRIAHVHRDGVRCVVGGEKRIRRLVRQGAHVPESAVAARSALRHARGSARAGRRRLREVELEFDRLALGCGMSTHCVASCVRRGAFAHALEFETWN